MLSFNVIREDQTTVSEISEYAFFGGETISLRLQLVTSYDNKPYFIPALSSVSVVMPNNTILSFTKAATIDPINSSIISVECSSVDTLSMISGYIMVIIDDAGDIRIAKRENVLRKIVI